MSVKHTAIIDINNDSVGLALLETPPRPTPEFICSKVKYANRVRASFQTHLNLKRFLDGVIESLRLVLSRFKAEMPTRPTEARLFLSAPFYGSQTRIIHRQSAEPVLITKRLIDNLVTRDIERFKSSQPQLYSEIVDDIHQVVESRIMQIKLNRYGTADPYHKRAREIEIHNYLSIGSQKILGRFREVVEIQIAPKHGVEFHSFPLALFSVARDLSLAPDNVLLVDLGGEITELSLISQGIMIETISFPLGRNFLARNLAERVNLPPAEAAVTLRELAQAADHQVPPAVRSVIDQSRSEWIDLLKKSLETLKESNLLPNGALFFCEESIANLFIRWLTEEKFDDLMLGQHKFEVQLLPLRTVARVCDGNNDNLLSDRHLMIESIFYDKLRSNNK